MICFLVIVPLLLSCLILILLGFLFDVVVHLVDGALLRVTRSFACAISSRTRYLLVEFLGRVARRPLRECHFSLFVGTQREDTTVIVHYSVRIRGRAGAPRVAVTRGVFEFDLCPRS